MSALAPGVVNVCRIMIATFQGSFIRAEACSRHAISFAWTEAACFQLLPILHLCPAIFVAAVFRQIFRHDARHNAKPGASFSPVFKF